MPIYLHSTTIAPEELTVTPNPRSGPVKFAVINLDGNGTGLTIHTPAEADQLIKAAVEAKRLLLGDTVPPALEQDLAVASADPANPYGSTRLDSLRDREHYDAAAGGAA